MWVESVAGGYAFIRDPWPGWQLLPVYTNAQLERYETVEVRGYMQTVAGIGIVVAQQVRAYLDSRGHTSPLFPTKGRYAAEEWPFMSTLPMMPVSPGMPLPTPPAPYSEIEPVPRAVPPAGSIAEAKAGGVPQVASSIHASSLSAASANAITALTAAQQVEGAVELEGKVVTAVFYDGTSQTISYFYIQEQSVGGNGIKVVPQIPLPVEPGNIVTVKATVVPSDTTNAECYVDASSVRCTGSMKVPGPVGACGRSTAGGDFGQQDALYLQTEDQSLSRDAIAGGGLSLVGTRVRVWGKVTAISTGSTGTTYFLDDGSGMKSNDANGEQAGLRVIVSPGSTTSYAQDDAVCATGVLGAELSEDPEPQPVPVLRVPAERTSEHIIRVIGSGGSDTHSGTNWTTDAMATISGALGIASEDDEIWVKAGTYNETVTLEDGVALYGGFAGTESLREERDWVNNESIVDADRSDSAVYAGYLSSPATRIDGFTITDGESEYGGGILCEEGSPLVIANNLITGNYALHGSGISIAWSAPLVWNNTIAQNDHTEAGRGTGIDCFGEGPDDPSATIAGNVISDNVGAWWGGGICCMSCAPVITDNEIAGNETDYYSGAGIYCYQSNASITHNNISENASHSDGGGVYCQYSNVNISHNTISSNSAYLEGGGLCLTESTATVTHNTIASNSADYEGGGLMCDSTSSTIAANTFDSNEGGDHGGGVALHFCDDTWVVNNVFVHNHTPGNAEYGAGGGGLQAYCSPAAIVNNTFVENYVGTGTWPSITPAVYGGAIHVRWPDEYGTAESVSIVNNIFYGNRAGFGNSVACTNFGVAAISYCDAWSTASASYHYYDVANPPTYLPSGLDAQTCTYLSPDFCGSTLYWLQPTSAVRGTGQNPAGNGTVPQCDKDERSRPVWMGLLTWGRMRITLRVHSKRK